MQSQNIVAREIVQLKLSQKKTEFKYPIMMIVRRSPPRRSPPQTFTTPDVHHPLCKIRRSPPQTFTTPDVHHLRRSPPQTFTTSDIHHPQCKIRRSPPQTFTTPDVHHLRHSPPQTFTTPYSKMRHSPRLFGLQEHFECLDGW